MATKKRVVKEVVSRIEEADTSFELPALPARAVAEGLVAAINAPPAMSREQAEDLLGAPIEETFKTGRPCPTCGTLTTNPVCDVDGTTL